MIAALWAQQLGAILEAIGRVYLILMFFVFARFLQEGKNTLVHLMNYWTKGAILLALITLIGYILALLGWTNECVRIYENYPYFGTVIRAAGLTGGSGMLVVVLMLPMLWSWYQFRYNKKSLFEPILFGLVLLLTLSKEVVLVVLGMLLIDPLLERWRNWQKAGLLILTTLFFIAGTHWIILPRKPIQDSYLGGMQYTPEKVSLYVGSFQLVETTYLELKRANWLIGWQHPIFGVGPGQFNQALDALKQKNQYARHLPNYDPHFTWGGAWSETGALGLLSLLFLWIVCGKCLLKNRNSPHPAQHVIAVFLLLMLIISTCMDVMNFRQLWLAAAIGLTEGNAKEREPLFFLPNSP
ncbi:hypothetical protein [Haliscomenobacter sp.]|uniref:hypothetical protein n=1 Tax=Haliscomenobacter sp. TaxID=2717303 RepID=UPI003593D53C